MPDEIKGFTHTEYLTVFIAIIFGYVGAEYFQGWGGLIRHRRTLQPYWQHTLWTLFAFILLIQNWWGIWPRTRLIDEDVFYFLYALVPIFLFHLISVILFPDFRKEGFTDMKEYFYSNTRWFFLLFASYFLMTIASSFVYPDIGDVTLQNLIRLGGVGLAGAAAYWNKSEKLHIGVMIIAYIMLFRFFAALP